MSLQVHVVKRKILAGEEAGREKYYGQVRMRQKLPLSYLARKVSADASATPGDVEMVINGLVHVIADNLENGNIVHLGDLGSMRISARSKGTYTEEEFKGWMMHSPRIVFVPGRDLSTMLSQVGFTRLSTITIDQREPCPFCPAK